MLVKCTRDPLSGPVPPKDGELQWDDALEIFLGVKCFLVFVPWISFVYIPLDVDVTYVFRGVKCSRTTFASCFTYYFHVVALSIPFGGDIWEKPSRDAFSYYFHMLALHVLASCIHFRETFKKNVTTMTLGKSFCVIALSETLKKSFYAMVSSETLVRSLWEKGSWEMFKISLCVSPSNNAFTKSLHVNFSCKTFIIFPQLT